MLALEPSPSPQVQAQVLYQDLLLFVSTESGFLLLIILSPTSCTWIAFSSVHTLTTSSQTWMLTHLCALNITLPSSTGVVNLSFKVPMVTPLFHPSPQFLVSCLVASIQELHLVTKLFLIGSSTWKSSLGSGSASLIQCRSSGCNLRPMFLLHVSAHLVIWCQNSPLKKLCLFHG